MQSGLVIYAIELDRMVRFYQNALGFRKSSCQFSETDDGFQQLENEAIELVLLQAPGEIVAQIEIAIPPLARSASAIKPVFFSAMSLAGLRVAVIAEGGGMNSIESEWSFGGRRVCDGMDVEGNIFQIRSGG